jgi:hypothetical protein
MVCRILLFDFTLREEHRLGVFENRVLRRTFNVKREDGDDCVMKSFITCTLHGYY